jgi:hypothetical protein
MRRLSILILSLSLMACSEMASVEETPAASSDQPVVQEAFTASNFELMAKELAENIEIYVQDGHNLELLKSEPGQDCTNCFVYEFGFDHYGDSMSQYIVSIVVADGVAKLDGKLNVRAKTPQ